MKTIHIPMEDEEYEALKKEKGEVSWHDFVMRLAEK
ncbi:hypothetical protein LCGC14_1858920 [marine sediment metagenome]|uniref:Uncharacterized protein n=1 Tax=marine sediment metagenome TaxID=412755 RepID=A0A0F9IMG5_9ZZZZ